MGKVPPLLTCGGKGPFDNPYYICFSQEVAESESISAMPTFKFYKDGKQVAVSSRLSLIKLKMFSTEHVLLSEIIEVHQSKSTFIIVCWVNIFHFQIGGLDGVVVKTLSYNLSGLWFQPGTRPCVGKFGICLNLQICKNRK